MASLQSSHILLRSDLPYDNDFQCENQVLCLQQDPGASNHPVLAAAFYNHKIDPTGPLQEQMLLFPVPGQNSTKQHSPGGVMGKAQLETCALTFQGKGSK